MLFEKRFLQNILQTDERDVGHHAMRVAARDLTGTTYNDYAIQEWRDVFEFEDHYYQVTYRLPRDYDRTDDQEAFDVFQHLPDGTLKVECEEVFPREILVHKTIYETA